MGIAYVVSATWLICTTNSRKINIVMHPKPFADFDGYMKLQHQWTNNDEHNLNGQCSQTTWLRSAFLVYQTLYQIWMYFLISFLF